MNAPSTGPAIAAPAATGTVAATRLPATEPVTGTDRELFAELHLEIPCEHPAHWDNPQHHRDGSEHYAHIMTPCPHGPHGVYVVCAVWLEWAHQFIELECPVCGVVQLITDTIKDLGLVADYHR